MLIKHIQFQNQVVELIKSNLKNLGKNNNRVFYILTIGIFLIFILPFQSVYSVGFLFDNIINLSNTPYNFSGSVQIAVSGTDVHIVWLDENFFTWDVFYSKSTDGGITF